MNSLRNRFRLLGFLFAATLLAACGGGSSDPAPSSPPAPQTGTVSGLVISSATGAPVSGATIRAGSATATSAADGSYTLTAGVSERAVISIAAPGFAETFQIARVATGRAASLEVQLLPVGVTQPITVAAGGTVTVPDSSAQVTIPAGALVSATGGAPANNVNVSLTPINPAIDSSVMPGDFTALLSGSTTPVPIESFGALRVDVRDANGVRYTLATGQTATIRIPVGTLSASPPPTIPLLIFNETTGRWVEEGVTTLAGTAQNLFYTGTVTRFGAWNADAPMDTVFISGCVRDTANQPVENVSVKADGVNYSGSDSTLTAADGSFRVATRRDGLATLGVMFPRNGKPVTTTANVGPYSADFTLTPCIVTEPVPLAMTARVLPSGIVGTPYSARLAATNGTKPYSWSYSGALPAGLTLDSATGQISGIPTTAGTFSGSFEVRDSSAPVQTASAPFSITVAAPAPLAMITPALPSGTVGVPYRATLAAINGTRPYAWSVIAGALPAGLTLDSASGQVSGIPTIAGTFTGTVQVQDSSIPMQSASALFSIIVRVPATLTAIAVTPSSASVVVGATRAFTATGSYSDGSTADITTSVTWTSGTPGVATVNATSGIATGVAVGTTTITASSGTFSGSATLTVTTTAPLLSTIAVTPASASVAVAGANQFTATGTYSDGSTANITSSVTWVSGTPSVATINTTGLATGVAAGTTTITAASGTMSGSVALTVTSGGAGGGWKVVSAGSFHTVAIKTDGTLWAWGANGVGELGDGTNVTKYTPTRIGTATTWAAVAAGHGHTVALQTDGTLWAWGYNSAGQLGDGTLVNKNTPTRIGIASTWAAVAAGDRYTVALQTDGTLWAWGYNVWGQLGDGTNVDKSTPTRIGTANTWAAVTAEGLHTVARQTDGTLWAWGFNWIGQIGDGTTVAKYIPTRIGTATTWAAVTAGTEHTVARQTDGTLWAWGANYVGQLGDGTAVYKSTPTRIGTATTWAAVTAGVWHTVARQADGTLWAWGLNTWGQLGDGTTVTKSTPTRIGTANAWAAVVAGNGHTVALQADGTLWAWGLNDYGQLGDGTNVNKNVPTPIP